MQPFDGCGKYFKTFRVSVHLALGSSMCVVQVSLRLKYNPRCLPELRSVISNLWNGVPGFESDEIGFLNFEFRKIFWFCLFCIFVHFFDFVIKKSKLLNFFQFLF